MIIFFQKIKQYFLSFFLQWLNHLQNYLSPIDSKQIVNNTSLKFLLPSEYKDCFEASELIEKKQEWILRVEEKKDQVPLVIRKAKEVVLNGFCNMVEITDFPFRGKPMYLQVYRRRWKIKGQRKSYENTHELHPTGMKATKDFGNFLKGLSRQEYHDFFCAWPNLRLIRS